MFGSLDFFSYLCTVKQLITDKDYGKEHQR